MTTMAVLIVTELSFVYLGFGLVVFLLLCHVYVSPFVLPCLSTDSSMLTVAIMVVFWVWVMGRLRYLYCLFVLYLWFLLSYFLTGAGPSLHSLHATCTPSILVWHV